MLGRHEAEINWQTIRVCTSTGFAATDYHGQVHRDRRGVSVTHGSSGHSGIRGTRIMDDPQHPTLGKWTMMCVRVEFLAVWFSCT